VRHPDFTNDDWHVADITLLKLKTKVEFTDTVQPACLPFSFSDEMFDGQNIWVSGWGAQDDGSQASVLRKVSLPVLTPRECTNYWGSSLIGDNRVLCAGVRGKSACNGDSGGPAVWVNGTEGYAFLVGVVSFGSQDCGRNGAPGGYSRVTKHLEWIQSTISADSSNTVKRSVDNEFRVDRRRTVRSGRRDRPWTQGSMERPNRQGRPHGRGAATTAPSDATAEDGICRV